MVKMWSTRKLTHQTLTNSTTRKRGNPVKEFMCTNCGMCCGPVPISKSELSTIKENIRNKSHKEVSRLKRQDRPELRCILWDTESQTCSIYEDRPEICKMFGFYQGMACHENPSFATKSRGEGFKRLEKVSSEPAGVLSVSIGWKELLK